MPPSSNTKRIMGIDPGYDRLGVAVLEKSSGKEILLFSTCLTSNRADTIEIRIAKLASRIRTLIQEWKPARVALETLYFAKNQKTAISVAELRGALLLVAYEEGVSVREYTPLQIKSTVAGYGTASKAQVAHMVEKLIKLEKAPKYDDEFDAIACALTASAHS